MNCSFDAIIQTNKHTQSIYQELIVLKDRIAEELSGLYGELPEISFERKLCALKSLPTYRRIILKGIFPWKPGLFLEKKEGGYHSGYSRILKKTKSNYDGELIKTSRGYYTINHLEMFDLETFTRLTELSNYYHIQSIRSGEFLHNTDTQQDCIWYDVQYIHGESNVTANLSPEQS